MMTTSDELFNELKREAVKIWQTYDNEFGYVDEKLAMLNKLQNVKDNFGTIIGMFDHHNQMKLYRAVSPESKALIDYWTGGDFPAYYDEARAMGL